MLAVGCNGGNGLHGTGPQMDYKQQAQDCSSDQTRSDQTRSPQLPVEITPGIRERRCRPESAEESSLRFRVGPRFEAAGQSRQAGEAIGGGGATGEKQTRE